MKKLLLLFIICASALLGRAQAFVDTLYHYDDTTLSYGSAVDFGGVVRDLQMDISIPNDDTPPLNGRPVMVLIHGGAFTAGTKNDAGIVAMRKDFAKRGYVTAAINYRLGMFQPAADWHCNISFIDGVEWDCLNVTDSVEWTRAYYRGIQDAHGAIRWLVNNAALYNIDPQNIFVVGESAGAFIAMGTGFMDNASDKPAGVGAIANAPLPNARYEQGCLVRYGTGTTNAALQLARPDLGSYEGTLNQPAAQPYRIKGVGDMYGAVFNNIFATNANPAEIPCLYLYHQPNDLIVPFNYDHLLIGYAYCCVTTFGCAYILNTPYVSGGNAIKDMIDALALLGNAVPDYQAEFTNNFTDCAGQIINPATGGHGYDNYWTRTNNMAVYFAPKITSADDQLAAIALQVYPNPSNGQFTISLGTDVRLEMVKVCDLLGKTVYQSDVNGHEFVVQMPAETAHGTYLLRVQTNQGSVVRRVVLE